MMKETIMKRFPGAAMFITAAAVCASLLLNGCGGGASTGLTSVGSTSAAGRGSIRVAVQWPPSTRAANSRLIPALASSIDVKVNTDDGALVASTTLDRPQPPALTTSATLDNVPAGHVTVTATASPGGGTPQATGTVSATVLLGQTVTTPALVMNSTITRLDLTSPVTTLTAGGPAATLAVSAKDKSGNVVLTPNSNFTWTSDNAAAVSVTRTGITATVQGIAAGTAHIRVTESDSGVASAPFTITVTTVTQTAGVANIVVSDIANHRIVGLDKVPATTFTAYNGTQGGGLAFSGSPSDVAIDRQGRIYIADYPYGIIRIDDLSGKNRVEYDPNADPVKSGPSPAASAVYVDAQGRIYWRDDSFAINRIDDMTGKNHVFFTNANFGAPAAIAVDGQGRIYVADGNASITGPNQTRGRIFRFDDMTGKNPHSFMGDGVSAPLSMALTGKILDIDAAGRLYIADNGNKRIVRIDPTALDDRTKANLVAFPMPKDSTGVPLSINAIAVTHGTSPTIYFTASGKGLADEYVLRKDDIQGTNLVKYGATGSGNGQFASPVGIAVK